MSFVTCWSAGVAPTITSHLFTSSAMLCALQPGGGGVYRAAGGSCEQGNRHSTGTHNTPPRLPQLSVLVDVKLRLDHLYRRRFL